MRKVKNFFSAIMSLVLVVMLVCTQPVQAYAATATPDLYSQGATEEVVIDNVVYTMHYFYENGNRAITISNSENSRIEKVTYNSRTAMTYYYENTDEINQSYSAPSGWIFMGSDSHYISWGEGMTVAAVAAVISIGLGFIGGAAVIAAMGTGVLGVLAAGAVGGTLYVESYYMIMPLQPIQYLYIWSFTASTGDSYGPYYYFPPVNY